MLITKWTTIEFNNLHLTYIEVNFTITQYNNSDVNFLAILTNWAANRKAVAARFTT